MLVLVEKLGLQESVMKLQKDDMAVNMKNCLKLKRREWIKLENVVKTLIPKITNAI